MSSNEAAERMFGYSAKVMIGVQIRCLTLADRQAKEDPDAPRPAQVYRELPDDAPRQG
jgi:hypothetical protein